MVELIFIIAIIAYIVKGAKKAEENQKRYERANQPNNPWDTVAAQTQKRATRVDSPRTQVQQQNTNWQKKAKENVEKEKQKTSAMQQIHEGRMEARNTTIVERAKANTDAQKADVTLETMEAEHNHSERVSAAIHHHVDDIIPENVLGTVEDLMVKGYDGNLCFERDFVGEGLDMISHFTVPTDVPDFS